VITLKKKILDENKEEQNEKKDIIGEYIIELFKTDPRKRRKGDHLGIGIYVSFWFIIPLFLFSNDPYISNAMIFYLFYDFGGALYIILSLFNERRLIQKGEIEEPAHLFEIPSFRLITQIFVFVIIIYLAYRVVLFFISPLLYNLSINNLIGDIFGYIRIVPAEEIVFRGLFVFLSIEGLSMFFNKEENKNIIISKKRKTFTKYDQVQKRIWLFTIIFVGTLFGLYHFFKFYDPSNFPYFFIQLGYSVYRVHILFPLVSLCILGIGLNYTQYKYGLAGSILLHFINNLFASAIIYAIFYLI